MLSTSAQLIPVSLLTGFLGSGKTTALNHLMQQPELSDTLVIINEFGEIPLDHQLVTHSTENVMMEMSSGCLCCTIRGDLIQTLRDITWRFSRNNQRQFNRVIIETTGLADPAPIIHTLMAHPVISSKYQLDGVIATVDISTGSSTLDRFSEAIKQAAVADTLLLTKSDLASEAEREAMHRRLDGINPAAPRWEIHNGQVSPSQVIDLGMFSVHGKSADVAAWLKAEAYLDDHEHHHHGHHGHHGHHDHHDHHEDHHHHDHEDHHGHAHEHHHDVNRHDDHIRAFCFSVDDPLPEDKLITWLDVLVSLLGHNILRVKAILNVTHQDTPLVLHGVQHVFHPPTPLPRWPSDDRRSHFVFITYDIKREVIEKSFHLFQKKIAQTT